jgi:hypothetical protein
VARTALSLEDMLHWCVQQATLIRLQVLNSRQSQQWDAGEVVPNRSLHCLAVQASAAVMLNTSNLLQAAAEVTPS